MPAKIGKVLFRLENASFIHSLIHPLDKLHVKAARIPGRTQSIVGTVASPYIAPRQTGVKSAHIQNEGLAPCRTGEGHNRGLQTAAGVP